MGTLLSVSSDSALYKVNNLIPANYVAVTIQGQRPYNQGADLVYSMRDYFLQEPYDMMSNEEILEKFNELPSRKPKPSKIFGLTAAISLLAPIDISFEDFQEFKKNYKKDKPFIQ